MDGGLKGRSGFARAGRWLPALAWGALIYNILVILWGAVVRITGAGAGCGDHWPLCNGNVIAQGETVKELIEYSHRLTSGLSGVLAIALVVLATRTRPQGDPVRLGAWLSLGLIILEGLVGGVQVRLGLTADSTHPARGFVQGIHLANTFALLGALLLTSVWASGGRALRLRGQGWLSAGAAVGLLLMLALGMAGAVTALGDLLFAPAGGTPVDTVKNDFRTTATIIENLRVVHPILAFVTSGYLLWFAARARDARGEVVARWQYALIGIIGVQMLVGFANVALKAPGWMQLTHLLLACIMWLVTVMLAYSALTAPARDAAPATPSGVRA